MLGRIANIYLIMTCLVVTTHTGLKIASNLRTPARLAALAKGQQLLSHSTESFLGPNGSLLIYTASNCTFCTQTLPALKRITALASQRNLRIVGLTHENLDTNRAYLSNAGLNVAHLAASSAIPALRATPTTVVLDPTGVVLGSWVGVLSAANEE
jgi:peroxiredoxin